MLQDSDLSSSSEGGLCRGVFVYSRICEDNFLLVHRDAAEV